ncbi:MAG: hypothetical protein J5644_05060 [Bacteroidales bacterium]|nr:hypothetical protein [Bacteroidales bacterium]
MKKVFGLIILLLTTYNLSYAQEYRATAVLDSNRILIGDQIHVDFTLTMPKDGTADFPVLTQEGLDAYGIDLVSSGVIDTTLSEQAVSYHQQWIVTAFDSGAYVFPSIAVLSPDSQLLAQSQPLPFWVNTIAVDTTAAIRDIKGIARVPLTFKEILPYLLIGLAAAAVLALLVWFILKHERKTKPQKKVVKAKPKVKPHIIALKNLEKLKIKKLWQNGQVKQYYSELTDIIRTYIDGRYDINAMEMITADILKELDDKGLPQELHKELEQTLTIADLVKFAKMEPLPDDHDRCFRQAVSFVQETAEKELKTEN